MTAMEMDRYREMMKGNIEYDILAERNPNQKAMLNEIVELMVETVCSQKGEMTIAGDTYPTEVVKSKFLKINSEHIEYILECMSKNTTQVRDIRNICWLQFLMLPTRLTAIMQQG